MTKVPASGSSALLREIDLVVKLPEDVDRVAAARLGTVVGRFDVCYNFN